MPERSEHAVERLADHTTLRLGGPAREFVTATDEAQLLDVVRRVDAAGTPLLLLAGGSNLVVGDAGFDGTVVRIATRGVAVEADSADGVDVRVAAGERWDDLVATACRRGWVGVEALAGIPGSVGATPIQNVGAYGQEVAQTITSLRTWDRREGVRTTFAAEECGFGYRASRFKAEPGRYVVLDVAFRFGRSDLGAPIAYAELARMLGVEVGEPARAADVRAAVLALRRSKGMVLDPDDHDTWSAGSFFTNPLVAPDEVPAGAPSWPVDEGRVKTSAAWLIEHAGFGKGYGDGAVGLSTRHTLALTNRGGATTADLIALAREIRDGVRRRFGIVLVSEPQLVGVEL